MRVKTAFTGFFTNRFVATSGISIVMLAFFFIASSFTKHSDRDLRAKQVNLIIREIGHLLLLQSGDSTSRLLPVTEINEGVFVLKFENEFVFSHDSLMMLSQSLLPKIEYPSGYTVTVHDCMKGDIIYGFQLNNTSPDILACSGRRQPAGCYTIEFVFPDFYENVKEKKAEIQEPTKEFKSAKVVAQEVHPKLAELKTTSFDNVVDKLTKNLKPVKVIPQEVNPKLHQFKTTIFNYPLNKVVYGGMLVLLVTTFLILRFGKNLKPVPVENRQHAIINDPGPELPALGNFLFNVKGQHLVFESEVISLTDKECKVLELLHKNFGELIPRETLMQKVWIDEGVITGRSLDMFVSKLRKKLSRDPQLRITNVHRKGYKLEIPEIEVS